MPTTDKRHRTVLLVIFMIFFLTHGMIAYLSFSEAIRLTPEERFFSFAIPISVLGTLGLMTSIWALVHLVFNGRRSEEKIQMEEPL